MRSFFNRIAEILAWSSGRRLAGRDLTGNKYYEIASPPGGGRPKRSVKYREIDHISDYTTGKHKLPIQWTSWLSHTRSNPPTIHELESDALRQSKLSPLINAINERERVERIRQGYATEGDRRLQVHSHSPEYEKLYGLGAAAGGSSARIESTRSSTARSSSPSTSHSTSPQSVDTLTTPPLTADTGSERPVLDTAAVHGNEFEQRAESPSTRQPYSIPTPPSSGIPPPASVDPARHSSKEDLRRLSEQDTKRRMAEGQVPEHPLPTSEQPAVQPAERGLKPRRRGAAVTP